MFYIVQAGADFQILDEAGAIFTTLSLPSGITVDATRRARFAVLNQKVVITNAPSRNLWVDPIDFGCYKLNIVKPSTAPTLAAGAAGILSGGYRYRVTFAHKKNGVVMNESPFSDDSAQVGLVNQQVSGSSVPVSADSVVNCRRIYRTTTDGAVYFFAFDLDDNTTTTFTDNLDDHGLDLVAADTTRDAPQGGSDDDTHLTLITTWKSRLWARSDDPALVDHILYTEENQIYGWSNGNDFPAYPEGEDREGITGFIPRRDSLGITKRNRVLKIIGSSEDDFDILIVVEGIGNVAPDAIRVIRDTGYFLGASGVYKWNDNDGVQNIAEAAVDAWFTKDRVFDRTLFPDAIGGYNPQTNSYELQLTLLGGGIAWVAVDLSNEQWFGPHLTAAFTPSDRVLATHDDGTQVPLVGGTDGYLYVQNQAGGQDESGAGVTYLIDPILTPGWLTQGDPDLTHHWGRLGLFTRLQASGHLLATATVGRLNSSAGATQSFDLTLGREVKNRLGDGALCKLRFTQTVKGEPFLLYGFEILDGFTIGRR